MSRDSTGSSLADGLPIGRSQGRKERNPDWRRKPRVQAQAIPQAKHREGFTRGRPADPASGQNGDIATKELVMLVAAVSRFLTRLSTMSAFRSAGLSLAEWCALSIIAGGEDVNSRQLAKTLGVSAQRINQTTASLRRSGFISVARAADDARKKVITITPNGSARLKQVDGELRRVIHSELPGKSRLFVRTRRLIVGKLMRAVLPAKGVTRG